MEIDDVRTVAVGAAVLARLICSALTLAVLGAMVEAAFPGILAWVGPGIVSALSVALRAFCLVGMGVVSFVMLAGVLAVAMVRLVTAPRVRTRKAGRHGAGGRGRRWQRAGSHRGPSWA